MSDVFREVDEDVRRDQWLKLWQAYGYYAIAAVVAVVLAVVGGVGWKEHRLSQHQAESEQFAAASRSLAEGQAEVAARQFTVLADSAGNGYGSLARLREAEALAAAGDKTAAGAVLDQRAADSVVETAIAPLASLMAAYQLMDHGSRDELERRLTPLMGADSPWRSSARELVGLIAFRAGETGAARQMFTDIVEDPVSPQAARSRAAGLLAILGSSSGDGG
ncbi:MAG: tetratricopeptide repeat protein [Pseudomonadota bacterium]|nr:tetratricopeptide repeat protein [Pseudomonadota bacterium]